jgi:phosphatidylserine/phosphatidylglycerophosphate/cardiolipin synthase-like enzyme
LASSTTPVDPAAARTLGQLLTGTEAREIADRLADGDTLTAALKVVAVGRRPEVRALLEHGAASGAPGTAHIVAVLRAVEGARSITTALDPLWTMPGHLAQAGPLTSSVTHLVDNSRQSITCSTFNFQRSSGLWKALRRAARRPEIEVRVYLDTQAADQHPKTWSPTTAEVAAHLRPGIVLRTKDFDGAHIRNHAKFLAIDHRFLLVTSANFSWSAEHGNVEFGVLIDNPNLTESVEREMRRTEDLLYERVFAPEISASQGT